MITGVSRTHNYVCCLVFKIGVGGGGPETFCWLNGEYGKFLLGHTIILGATLLIPLMLLLINLWLSIFTIPLITATKVVQIYHDRVKLLCVTSTFSAIYKYLSYTCA